jgi:hypothetical protein
MHTDLPLHKVNLKFTKCMKGVSKTKTYENEDRRPKMGLRNYENEEPLRKRRPIFVFVLRKRRP